MPMNLALSFAALLSMVASLPAADLPAGYKLLYEQKFEKPGALKDFVFSDANAWRLATNGTNISLELFQQSKYTPKDRSPLNIALVANKVFGDFVLDVELLSTKAPYPHQDMCVFYGFQNTNRFYYTHIAAKADPVKAESHAHDCFIVNDAPRLAFAKTVTDGVKWGEAEWHKIRVERKIADGTIKIYFDDLTRPIMVAEEKTFTSGYIGFGSFDDIGKIDNIKIYGPSMTTKKTPFFQPAKK